jgi:ribose transport system substrate-binding protein
VWADCVPVRCHRALVAALALTAVLAVTAGCSGDGGDAPDPAPPGGTAAGSSGAPGDIVAEAKTTLDLLYKGNFEAPDPATRIAAKGKKLAVISLSQSAPSSYLPVNAAAAAGAALGWQVQVYDLKFDPRKTASVVRDAVSAGTDAIVTLADCGYAPEAFAEAKAKGVLIAPLYSFDCTDPTVAGAAGPSQFTTFVNYGVKQVDNARFTAGVGALTASVLIAATDGKAKVIEFTDPYSTILNYTHLGFKAQMERCTTCQLLETVNLPSAETPAVQQRLVRESLERHPDATAIRISHSSATQLAIAPVLVQTGRHNQILVFGGEGQDRDLDLIRTKQGLNMTLSTDTEWFGWAVVDALNSAFNGEEPRPTGMGGMLVDREHNLPPSGPVQHNINYRNIYRKAWGVG